MRTFDKLLLRVLRQPSVVPALQETEWDLLIRQARAANLLPRLQVILAEHELLPRIPAKPYSHLDSARLLAEKQHRDIIWEVQCIQDALAGIAAPVILLKGAAYVMAGLPAAQGRIFSDIDIMVPREKLPAVEKSLRLHGWQPGKLDEYDQRYYRQWMHELPPLRHIRRNSVIDVHHTILPPTASLHPDPARLRAAALDLDGYRGLQVLAPVDMVLHSATHLFHEGEFEQGLRDLVDLDALLGHFGREDGFWSALPGRAEELELGRPLYYALRYAQLILDTRVPDEVWQSVRTHRPGWPLAQLMDQLFTRGLMPDHVSCDDRLTGVARWCLYVRGHALRMPMHLLLPHLVRKAIRHRLEVSAA